MGNDMQTGGYAIFLNLAYQYGEDDWLAGVKANLLQQYSTVMLQDLAGSAGPEWFRIGLIQWMAYSNITQTPAELSVTHYADRAKAEGTLLSLYDLTKDWSRAIKSDGASSQAAYGAAYLAVKHLAGNVGGMPLIQTLIRNAKGEDFESALINETGFSTGKLESEYRNYIPTR